LVDIQPESEDLGQALVEEADVVAGGVDMEAGVVVAAVGEAVVVVVVKEGVVAKAAVREVREVPVATIGTLEITMISVEYVFRIFFT
jgi:hypothetical protein